MEDNISTDNMLSDSDESSQKKGNPSVKLNPSVVNHQINPFTQEPSSSARRNKKRKGNKNKGYDNCSDYSFNSTKMIDGYKDFVITI